jgi:hypothetical protein
MQRKGLANIFMVVALVALLVTLGSVQSAFAGGRSGSGGTKNAGPLKPSNVSGPKVTKDAGPQNPGDGPQSGFGDAPLGGTISGPRVTSGSPGITADNQLRDKLPGKKKP